MKIEEIRSNIIILMNEVIEKIKENNLERLFIEKSSKEAYYIYPYIPNNHNEIYRSVDLNRFSEIFEKHIEQISIMNISISALYTIKEKEYDMHISKGISPIDENYINLQKLTIEEAFDFLFKKLNEEDAKYKISIISRDTKNYCLEFEIYSVIEFYFEEPINIDDEEIIDCSLDIKKEYDIRDVFWEGGDSDDRKILDWIKYA